MSTNGSLQVGYKPSVALISVSILVHEVYQLQASFLLKILTLIHRAMVPLGKSVHDEQVTLNQAVIGGSGYFFQRTSQANLTRQGDKHYIHAMLPHFPRYAETHRKVNHSQRTPRSRLYPFPHEGEYPPSAQLLPHMAYTRSLH